MSLSRAIPFRQFLAGHLKQDGPNPPGASCLAPFRAAGAWVLERVPSSARVKLPRGFLSSTWLRHCDFDRYRCIERDMITRRELSNSKGDHTFDRGLQSSLRDSIMQSG
jgi:hypothetical protein